MTSVVVTIAGDPAWRVAYSACCGLDVFALTLAAIFILRSIRRDRVDPH